MICLLLIISSVLGGSEPIDTQKEETAHRSLSEAKLLFFSVLLAISQRNNHFCGCKGTHYY